MVRNPKKTVTKEITLEAGRSYDLRLEYFQTNREAVAETRLVLPAACGTND